jgi:hypothetical protein
MKAPDATRGLAATWLPSRKAHIVPEEIAGSVQYGARDFRKFRFYGWREGIGKQTRSCYARTLFRWPVAPGDKTWRLLYRRFMGWADSAGQQQGTGDHDE